jgi:hypothetical protein
MVGKPITEAVDDCKCWQLTRADWDLLKDLSCIESRLNALDRSNNIFNQFTLTLINIAEKTIPKTCGKLKI